MAFSDRKAAFLPEPMPASTRGSGQKIILNMSPKIARVSALEVDGAYEKFFHLPKGKKVHFDLPAFILSRLAVMNVRAEWTGHCTYALEDSYFSYRRNTHRKIEGYGRNLSAIVLPRRMDSENTER